MGLLDFFLKHGGGPGAIARRQARHYKRLRSQSPGASEVDILTLMYVGRAQAGEAMRGCKGEWYRRVLACDPDSVQQFRSKADLSLRELVMRIVEAEDPNMFGKPVEFQMMVMKAVEDVLDEEVPDWRNPRSDCGTAKSITGVHDSPLVSTKVKQEVQQRPLEPWQRVVDLVMPKLDASITQGTVTKWLKRPVTYVHRDEPLFEISTDKVDVEVPSPVSGNLIEIFVEEGQTVAIDIILGKIVSEE